MTDARALYPALVTPPAPGAPLVFAFHGTGGDEHQFAGLVPQLLPGAGLVAPRGDVSEQGANRFFRRTGEGVYDMDDLARARDRLVAFVAAQKAGHPGHRALAFGYSNGANILAAMSFVAPGLFDGLALLHPLIPFAPPPQQGLAGQRVLITGGRRDPIGPLALTEALAGYYRDQGADLTLALHPGGHELRAEELQSLATFLRKEA